jgi:hypothetical protein
MAATVRFKPAEENIAHRLCLQAQHCPQEEYEQFVGQLGLANSGYPRKLAAWRFVSRWPDLVDWMKAPRRTVVKQTSARQAADARLSQNALGYLLYLGIRGYAKFDYPWLLTARPLFLPKLARRLDIDLGIEQLKIEAERLGFSRTSIDVILRWTVTRLALHTGITDARRFTGAQIEEFKERGTELPAAS